MIFIDTNVFVIDLRYPRDPLQTVNRKFLRAVKERGRGATTLVNLLEVAGILSHNLSPEQLREMLVHFPSHYGLKVYPPLDASASLPPVPVTELIERIGMKLPFGDAMVLDQVERHAPRGSVFVSWDAKHFAGRTGLPVLTPREFLKKKPSI